MQCTWDEKSTQSATATQAVNVGRSAAYENQALGNQGAQPHQEFPGVETTLGPFRSDKISIPMTR